MDIEELNLDIISYNKLKRLNINTVEDFNARREDVAKEHPLTYRKVLIKLGEDELCKDHDDREKAMKLHQRIMASGTLAAQNLWEMCTGLKEMRDKKLYKELGYSKFETYCTEMCGFSDRNARNYISIIENISEENRKSISGIGMTKLSLLAALSEEKQTEIAETVDLESVTVRQLKEEINKLKSWNKDLGTAKDRATANLTSLEEEINKLKGEKMIIENEKDKLETELEDKSHKVEALTAGLSKAQERANKAAFHEQTLQESYKHLEETNSKHYENYKAEREKVRTLTDENARLEKENKELRERPVEVAVEDHTEEYEKKLAAAIEKERRKNDAQTTELQKDFNARFTALREEYEVKIKEAQESADEDKDKQEFKVFLVMAHDALTRLTAIANTHADEPVYAEKLRGLLEKFSKMLEA